MNYKEHRGILHASAAQAETRSSTCSYENPGTGGDRSNGHIDGNWGGRRRERLVEVERSCDDLQLLGRVVGRLQQARRRLGTTTTIVMQG
jgi:hypothetical protein